MENPKVHIKEYIHGEGGYNTKDVAYDLNILLEAIKGLDVFDIQLAAIDLSVTPWSGDIDIRRFIYHMNRCNKTEPEYPIILNPSGYIIDGWHRVVKAIIDGKTEIPAVRLITMPEGYDK